MESGFCVSALAAVSTTDVHQAHTGMGKALGEHLAIMQVRDRWSRLVRVEEGGHHCGCWAGAGDKGSLTMVGRGRDKERAEARRTHVSVGAAVCCMQPGCFLLLCELVQVTRPL